MAVHATTSRLLVAVLAVLATSSLVSAQSLTPPAPAAGARPDSVAAAKPATPPSPVSGIRNKISAGDLLSAESILEVYREKYGEDSRYCSGLAWLARGALLLGEREKAERYAAEVRSRCAGARLTEDEDLAVALGAAIETDAQRVERQRGAAAAAALVRADLEQIAGPVSLRARLQKRLNLLTLTGTRAPELTVEDWIGTRPPALATLAGKPVLLFVWAEGCGDCRAQAATLARVKTRHAAEGLQVVALSRYYESDAARRPAEKARADSVWRADYAAVGEIPRVISTESMERYGGSSTPTFVFVDRRGMVRDYTPTRLTDSEFERRLAAILR